MFQPTVSVVVPVFKGSSLTVTTGTYRRVATRHEKRAGHYVGMPLLAALLLWL